jgi:ribose 5-phosphate isomerase B
MSNLADRGIIAIGADHAGFTLKEQLKQELVDQGISVEDLGTDSESSTDYPQYAHAVAKGIEEKRFAAGILVCGTGIGMSMAANRHCSVRAAVCTEPSAARLTRQHNDANVLCIGARMTGAGLASEIVRAFLSAEFEGGRHSGRVAKIEPDS